MKIIRAVNNVPIEIELNAQEEYELFEEMYLKRITDNLFYALEMVADDDDPDKNDPFSASNALAALRRSPELTKIVAYKFDEYVSGLCDGEQEYQCAIDAYTYMVKGREVNK